MLFSKQQITRKIIEVKVLVAQSCLDSLQAHGLQPARLLRPWLIHAFELLYWRRLLRAPRAARRSNQSILKEINSEYSLGTDAEAPILWPCDAKIQLTGHELE